MSWGHDRLKWGECHKANSLEHCKANKLGCHEANSDEMGVILSFCHFNNIYHFAKLSFNGVVHTVHIWWKFNIVNSRYGGE